MAKRKPSQGDRNPGKRKAKRSSRRPGRRVSPSPSFSPPKRGLIKSDSRFFKSKEELGISKVPRGSFTGGGHVTYRVGSRREALRLLKIYKGKMAFWQASRIWIVRSGKGRKQRIRGYSRDVSPNVITPSALDQALVDSATNAAKQLGFRVEYEAQAPSSVSSTSKSFQIIIWFSARHKKIVAQLR